MRPILALLIAFAVIATLSAPADAAKAKAKSRDASRSTKLCLATRLDNRRTTWKCPSSDRCCWDAFASVGACVPSNGVCF